MCACLAWCPPFTVSGGHRTNRGRRHPNSRKGQWAQVRKEFLRFSNPLRPSRPLREALGRIIRCSAFSVRCSMFSDGRRTAAEHSIFHPLPSIFASPLRPVSSKSLNSPIKSPFPASFPRFPTYIHKNVHGRDGALRKWRCHRNNFLGCGADAAVQRPREPRPLFQVYTPYFVEFPNKSPLFDPFYGLVYSFTYIYTKNVRGWR